MLHEQSTAELLELADEQIDKEDFVAAIATCTQVLANSFLVRSSAFSKAKMFEEALADVASALSLIPEWPDAIESKGLILYEAGRYDESAEFFQQLISLQPSETAYVFLADIAYGKGRYAEAVALAEKALHVNPNCGYAYIAKGLVHWDTEEYDTAYDMFIQALELDTSDTVAAGRLAQLAYKRERQDEAFEYAERALRSNAENHRALWIRGLVQRDRGNTELGDEDIAAARKIAPDFPFDLNSTR